MYITYHVQENSVFGSDNTTGIDKAASLEALRNNIDTALCAQYKDAYIEVTIGGGNGIDALELMDDEPEDRDIISGIITETWEKFDWLVYLPKRATPRFYVTVRSLYQTDPGTIYGPFYSKSEALKFAASAEVTSGDIRDQRTVKINTHTQMIERFGRSFENAPYDYVVGTKLDAHLR